MDTLAVVTQELELKGASVRRLRKLIFGSSSEKMKNLFPDDANGNLENSADLKIGSDSSAEEKMPSSGDNADEGKNDEANKPKRKGHDRTGAKEAMS